MPSHGQYRHTSLYYNKTRLCCMLQNYFDSSITTYHITYNNLLGYHFRYIPIYILSVVEQNKFGRNILQEEKSGREFEEFQKMFKTYFTYVVLQRLKHSLHS